MTAGVDYGCSVALHAIIWAAGVETPVPMDDWPACPVRITQNPYRRTLTQYHLHPESRFSKAGYTDRGATIRRHIHAVAIEHIGKEANRWEEQLFLGPEA